MAFWVKKKSSELIKKYLIEQNVTFKEEMGLITFEFFLSKSNFSIFPYINIDDAGDQISILINLRQVNNLKDFEKLNDFNLKSKYFTAKIKDEVLFLEYNTHILTENANFVMSSALDSLIELQVEIDNL
ncbi:TPA: hypothetical protein IAA91_05815 [Candidatus Avacholeplasma faecigallinarum]|nr:hypothetical protein [Candidatus Avacholeplasma faecigallinarum]